MPSRTIASLALACASLADAFAPAPSTRLAPLRHAPQRSLVARSSSSDVFGGASTLAVAGTGSSDDPFLIGLAGASIVLFVFVVGSVVFLTAKEQLTKKEINEDEFKPRLPTMAELGDVDDDAAAAPPMPMAEGSNRRARRENQKLMKKPPPKLGDSARF